MILILRKQRARFWKASPREVSVALNGEEGLQKARKEKPDLVLLDIMMPVKDGFLVAEEFGKDQVAFQDPGPGTG